MTDQTRTMGLEAEMAAPLHLQRLERSLNMQPFLCQVNQMFRDQIRYYFFFYHIYNTKKIISFFLFNLFFLHFSEDEESSEDESADSEADLNELISQKEGLFYNYQSEIGTMIYQNNYQFYLYVF